MNAAKIRLSPTEMALLKNADWILTKNQILDKVKSLLGELVSLQKVNTLERIRGVIPEEVLASSFKISRGENYHGLPWLVLDHPRCFEKNNTMAIRTLLWWGRSFSVTLHLSGRYKSLYEEVISGQYDFFINQPEEDPLKNNTLYVCINEGEWEHHFDETNYKPIRQLSQQEWQAVISGKSFIKLAKMIPVDQWNSPDDINDILAWHYDKLVNMLAQRS